MTDYRAELDAIEAEVAALDGVGPFRRLARLVSISRRLSNLERRIREDRP